MRKVIVANQDGVMRGYKFSFKSADYRVVKSELGWVVYTYGGTPVTGITYPLREQAILDALEFLSTKSNPFKKLLKKLGRS